MPACFVQQWGRLRCVGLLGAALFLASASARAESWPELSTAARRTGGGEQDAAIVVGLEHYVFLPPVPGAQQNARDWYVYLTQTRGVPIGRVKLLQNHEATREAIDEAAREAAAMVNSRGTLWFVFIGHGAPSPSGKDGLLIGADAQQTAGSLEARGLPQKVALAALEKGRQAETVVVIDACFSGRSASGKALVEGLQPLVVVRKMVVEQQPARQVLLMAAKSDQFAGPLPELDRPAFSYLVLGGLRGWADKDKNGQVTAEEVTDFARNALAGLLVDRSQTPELVARDATRVLASSSGEKGPDVAQHVMARSSELQFSGGVEIKVPQIVVKAEAGLKSINIAAERALDVALDNEESKRAPPEQKAAGWCALGQIAKNNPYQTKAEQACRSWTAYAETLRARERAMDQDYRTLSGYLVLRHKTPDQKTAALDAFLAAYSSTVTASDALGLGVAVVKEARRSATAGRFEELPATLAEMKRVAAEAELRESDRRRDEQLEIARKEARAEAAEVARREELARREREQREKLAAEKARLQDQITRASALRKGGLVSMATGTTVTALAAVFAAMGASVNSQIRSGGFASGAALQSAWSAGQIDNGMAYASLVVGAVSAGVGAILYFVGRRRHPEKWVLSPTLFAPGETTIVVSF